jgi:hypothetical protein
LKDSASSLGVTKLISASSFAAQGYEILRGLRPTGNTVI